MMFKISGISKFEYKVFYFIVFLKIFFSAAVLNHFIGYTLPGGTLFEKLHPGFYLLCFLLISLLLKKKFIFLSRKDRPFEIRVFLWYAIALLILMVTFYFLRGTSQMGYLVETHFTATVFVLIVFMLNKQQKTNLLNMILLFVLFNSLFAIVEFIFRFHLVYDGAINPFRSSALLGHPLNNALITSFALFFVFSTKWRRRNITIYIMIGLIAILAYGARAAFIGVNIGFFLMGTYFLFLHFRKKRLYLHIFLLTWGLPVLLIIGYQIIFGIGLGYRIFATELFDSSGIVRLDLFQIFNLLSFNELLFGMEPHYFLAEAMKIGVLIIENFWVGFILQFGLILGLPVLLMMVLTIYFFQKNEPGHLKIASLVFFLVASSNNSLTSKTAALSVFLTLLCCTMAKNNHVPEDKKVLQ